MTTILSRFKSHGLQYMVYWSRWQMLFISNRQDFERQTEEVLKEIEAESVCATSTQVLTCLHSVIKKKGKRFILLDKDRLKDVHTWINHHIHANLDLFVILLPVSIFLVYGFLNYLYYQLKHKKIEFIFFCFIKFFLNETNFQGKRQKN